MRWKKMVHTNAGYPVTSRKNGMVVYCGVFNSIDSPIKFPFIQPLLMLAKPNIRVKVASKNTTQKPLPGFASGRAAGCRGQRADW